MYDIVGRRKIWYILSLLMLLPGVLFMGYSLVTRGTILPLNIDYTGGTLWEMRYGQAVDSGRVRQVFVDAGYADTTAFTVDDDGQTVQVKFTTISPEEKEQLVAALVAVFGDFDERSYRSIGPAIGSEVSRAAIGAVAVASLAILLYIAWAFRQVSHPLRYGTCAILALVHDVLVTVSFVWIMHFVAGWEVDALFLTAILTVIGFSVNDTIVVFDRIRENLRKHRSEDLATVANRSLLETMSRSLGTQITVFLVMVALLVFGGASVQQFMATMLAGMVSGTYSSIFFGTPMLVAWEERSWFGGGRKPMPVTGEGAVAV
jgi:preprotein translocase subunit SecF